MEVADGRAERSPARGDGEQAAISLMPDTEGTHVSIFQSSQLEESYAVDLLFVERRVKQQ